MTKFDECLMHGLKSEERSRMKFLLANSDLVYANAKASNTELRDRMQKLKTEILEANTQINDMKSERTRVRKQDIGFHKDEYRRKLTDSFPEHIDPRAFTHAMRPVPPEHLHVLYSNSDKTGTKLYMKERWSVPPNKRYYFPMTTYDTYGWMEPFPSSMEPFHGRTSNMQEETWRKNGLAMFVVDKQLPMKKYLYSSE